MNANDILPWLQDIGDEGRRIAEVIHGYHMLVRFKDGRVAYSDRPRFYPRSAEHMERMISWLRESKRGDNIESITLIKECDQPGQGKRAQTWSVHAPTISNANLDWRDPWAT